MGNLRSRSLVELSACDGSTLDAGKDPGAVELDGLGASLTLSTEPCPTG
jgi:hypothetical protein